MEKWGKQPISPLLLLLSCFPGCSLSSESLWKWLFCIGSGQIVTFTLFHLRLDEQQHSSALFSGKGSYMWSYILFSWMSASVFSVNLLSLQWLQESLITLISLPSLHPSLTYHSLYQVQCLYPQLHDTSEFSSPLLPSFLNYFHAVQLLLQMNAPQSFVHSFTPVVFPLYYLLHPKHPPRSCLLDIFPKASKASQGQLKLVSSDF